MSKRNFKIVIIDGKPIEVPDDSVQDDRRPQLELPIPPPEPKPEVPANQPDDSVTIVDISGDDGPNVDGDDIGVPIYGPVKKKKK